MINKKHQTIELSRPGNAFGIKPKDIAERDLISRFIKRVFKTVCARINAYGGNHSHPNGGSSSMYFHLQQQALQISNQFFSTKYLQLEIDIKHMRQSNNRDTIAITNGIGNCQEIAIILFKALSEAQLAQKNQMYPSSISGLKFGYIYTELHGDHVFNYAKAINGNIYLIDCWAQKLVLVDLHHPDYTAIARVMKGGRIDSDDNVRITNLMSYGISTYTNAETEYAVLNPAKHPDYKGYDMFAYYAARVDAVTVLYRDGKLSQEAIESLSQTMKYLNLTRSIHGLNDLRQIAKLNNLKNLETVLKQNLALQQKLVKNHISSSEATVLLLHYRGLFNDSGLSHPDRYSGINNVLMLTGQMIEAKEEEEANNSEEQNRNEYFAINLLNGVTRK